MRTRTPRRPWYRNYLPGWWAFNPGSGGGGGTVTTDGVTIQGNGSAGSPIALLDAITDGVTLQGAGISSSKLALKAIQTTARLMGTGTVASPLDVTGWPLPGWVSGGWGASARFFASTANKLNVYGVIFPAPVLCSNITLDINTADAVNNCDIGFYNSAGVLLAHIGAQTIPATGLQTYAIVGGPLVIPAGTNYFATTSAANTAILFITGGGGLAVGWGTNLSYGASTGGALPASITPPGLSASGEVPNYVLT